MDINKKVDCNSFTYKDFSFILNKYNYNLNVGDIVAGKIFNQEKNGFIVEIGTDIASYLPKEELSLNIKNVIDLNKDIREFFILAYNRNSNQLIVSIKRIEYIKAWTRIKQMYEEDIILELYIININKGGLIALVEGIKGFIPNSHLLHIQDKKSLLNTCLKCKFLVVNEKQNKLLFSHKRALLSIYGDKLRVGQIVESTITDIKNYGLFLSINQIPTLLHISEISNQHIGNINKSFYIGEQVQVKIMHIDRQQGRLSVSRRNLY